MKSVDQYLEKKLKKKQPKMLPINRERVIVNDEGATTLDTKMRSIAESNVLRMTTNREQ